MEKDYTEFQTFQKKAFAYLQDTGFYLKGITLEELHEDERERFIDYVFKIWESLGEFRSLERTYKKKDNKSKRVYMYTQDGKFLNTFPSMTAAALWIGKPGGGTNIAVCCEGINNSAYGYRWSFEPLI